MKSILILIALFLACIGHSQTKLIAHKSHGGSTTDFQQALKNDRTLDASNFGEAPVHFVSRARLDSVIYINDSVVVMVTSIMNKKELFGNRVIMNELVCSQRPSDSSMVWKPGRDTLESHDVFSSGLPVERMRLRIEMEYNFANEVNSIQFIGFDKSSSKSSEQKKGGFAWTPFSPPSGNGPWMMIVGMALILALTLKIKLPQEG